MMYLITMIRICYRLVGNDPTGHRMLSTLTD